MNRLKLNTRWIPKDSRAFTRTEGTDAAIYLHESQNIKTGRTIYYAIYYHGKANKPDQYIGYRSAQARAEAIKLFIDGRRQRAELMTTQRQKRTEPHSLKVGDILKNSWGYDQTNIDYYEVTRVISPHTVEIREIGQDRKETGFMQGRCVPQSGAFIGEPMIKRASADNSVKIHEWGSWAHKVDKLNVGYWTSYA